MPTSRIRTQLPAKNIAHSRLDVICFAKRSFARPPRLFRALIDSKMETNLHPIMDLRMFASSDKALLIFQLSTLLFGNSFSSRGCCSLPAAYTLSL